MTGAPYQTSVEFMKKHDIDFCAHGEDVTILANGRDSFHEVKEAGMFKLIKRTDGVSTTDLLGIFLFLSFSFSFSFLFFPSVSTFLTLGRHYCLRPSFQKCNRIALNFRWPEFPSVVHSITSATSLFPPLSSFPPRFKHFFNT